MVETTKKTDVFTSENEVCEFLVKNVSNPIRTQEIVAELKRVYSLQSDRSIHAIREDMDNAGIDGKSIAQEIKPSIIEFLARVDFSVNSMDLAHSVNHLFGLTYENMKSEFANSITKNLKENTFQGLFNAAILLSSFVPGGKTEEFKDLARETARDLFAYDLPRLASQNPKFHESLLFHINCVSGWLEQFGVSEGEVKQDYLSQIPNIMHRFGNEGIKFIERTVEGTGRSGVLGLKREDMLVFKQNAIEQMTVFLDLRKTTSSFDDLVRTIEFFGISQNDTGQFKQKAVKKIGGIMFNSNSREWLLAHGGSPSNLARVMAAFGISTDDMKQEIIKVVWKRIKEASAYSVETAMLLINGFGFRKEDFQESINKAVRHLMNGLRFKEASEIIMLVGMDKRTVEMLASQASLEFSKRGSD